VPIHADLHQFLSVLDRELDGYGPCQDHTAYLALCRERVARYPTVLPEYWTGESGVNPYCFGSALFDALDSDDVIVTGDGTACVVTFQSANLKAGQRLFSNSCCASMGYDVPAAIGAYFAKPTARQVGRKREKPSAVLRVGVGCPA